MIFNVNILKSKMPKYILIGLGIPIILFLIMHYWSQFTRKTKNKIIASIFGVIAIIFVVLIALLIL